MDLESLINTCEWKFAKTYAQSFPHEYILQEWHPELFKQLVDTIKREGYKKYRYLELGGYKYWRIGNVLNREPLKGYTVQEIDDKLNDR